MPIQIPGYQPINAPLDLNIGQLFGALSAQQQASPFDAGLQRGFELGYKDAGDQRRFEQELAQRAPLTQAQTQQALAHRDKYLSDVDLGRRKFGIEQAKGYMDLQKGALELTDAQQEANNKKISALLPHLMNKTPEELAEASPLVHHVFSQLNPAYSAVVDTKQPVTQDTLKAVTSSLLSPKDRLAIEAPEKLGKLSQLNTLYDQNKRNYESAVSTGDTRAAMLYNQRLKQTEQAIQKEITPTPGQRIEINTNDSVRAAVLKAEGLNDAALIKDDQKRVRDENDALASIQSFRAAAPKAITTGPVADKRLFLSQLSGYLSKSLGIKYDPTKVANTEVLLAKTKDFVEMRLAKMKGSTSDYEGKEAKTSVPNLGNSPQGNEAILNIMESDIKRTADMYQFEREYLEKNGSLTGFDRQLKRYQNDYPKTDPKRNFGLIPENFGKYEAYLDKNYKGRREGTLYSYIDQAGKVHDISLGEVEDTARELNQPIEKVMQDLKLSPKQ